MKLGPSPLTGSIPEPDLITIPKPRLHAAGNLVDWFLEILESVCQLYKQKLRRKNLKTNSLVCKKLRTDGLIVQKQ